MKHAIIAASLCLAATPAWADPDTHQVTLPDGRIVVTITDPNSQLVAPSTTLRVVVECDAGPTNCTVVSTNVVSSALLSGLFNNAVGDALRRPHRTNINNGNANSNSSASNSAASAASAAAASAEQSQDQQQGQGQIQLQLQGQTQEQGQGGGDGDGDGGNGNCGVNGGDGNGNGNTCGD